MRCCQSYLSLLWVIAISLALSACGSSPPTRYYYLPSADDGIQPVDALSSTVGVGPVSVAAYLERPQITTSDGESRLYLAQFDYWAESLDKAVLRVVADRIADRSDGAVYTFPWRRDAAVRYAVTIRIDRLDRVHNHAILQTTWAVADTKQSSLQQYHRTITVVVEDGSYMALADAYSELLIMLADEIMASIMRNGYTD